MTAKSGIWLATRECEHLVLPRLARVSALTRISIANVFSHRRVMWCFNRRLRPRGKGWNFTAVGVQQLRHGITVTTTVANISDKPTQQSKSVLEHTPADNTVRQLDLYKAVLPYTVRGTVSVPAHRSTCGGGRAVLQCSAAQL
jgi:hypothetical protein